MRIPQPGTTTFWYDVLPADGFRTSTISASLSSSPGVSTTVCQPTGLSLKKRSARTGIHRDGSIAGPSSYWTVLSAPTGGRRHDRGGHSVQRMARRHYLLHAFVVIPNHVHLLATPAVALPQLMKSLKGITAKRANAILGLTGSRFWQEESYDHAVRHQREFDKIRSYIEENPVRAGLVNEAGEYRWSSAGQERVQGTRADLGVCPTNH